MQYSSKSGITDFAGKAKRVSPIIYMERVRRAQGGGMKDGRKEAQETQKGMGMKSSRGVSVQKSDIAQVCGGEVKRVRHGG
jgi:hypothetical protein